MGEQQIGDRRVQVASEPMRQCVRATAAVEEMEFRPGVGETANWIGQPLDHPGMPVRFSPDQAGARQQSLQEGRTGSPTSGEDEHRVVNCMVRQVRPSAADRRNTGGKGRSGRLLGHRHTIALRMLVCRAG